MIEKIWRKKVWFAKNIFWSARCVALRGENFVIKYLDEIQTEFENYSSLFIGGPDGFESWKNRGRKSRDTLPLSITTHNFKEVRISARGLPTVWSEGQQITL